MATPTATGYAPVNGLELYWERFCDADAAGSATPLILVHGGYGSIGLLDGVITAFSAHRPVIAIELQGHGHTRDTDRPFSYEAWGDDIGALAPSLGLASVDVLGYSLGAGATLRAAIQHPDVVRRLVVVSFPFRRDGWFPEVRAGFDTMDRALFEVLQHSPMYAAYQQIAPDVAAFPTLIDKTGELHRRPFDWADDVRGLTVPTLLVFADADSIPAAHIADFYALLDGGLRDSMLAQPPRSASQLAVMPNRTHYDVIDAPGLIDAVEAFLGGSD
ncbi:MAG TPA: alpha/beta hydrolase [Acidimicrobiia bacterium]